MDNFVNMMSKNVYYINMKDRVSYQIWPLTYDAKFKSYEEITQLIIWISFPDLLPYSLWRNP